MRFHTQRKTLLYPPEIVLSQKQLEAAFFFWSICLPSIWAGEGIALLRNLMDLHHLPTMCPHLNAFL